MMVAYVRGGGVINGLSSHVSPVDENLMVSSTKRTI